MKIITIAFLISSITSAHAEFRTWTSAQGSSVEAEYRGSKDGVAILKTRNGSECKLSPESLCESDQKYLKSHHFEYEPEVVNGKNRIWTDVKGNHISAAYRGVSGSAIVLLTKEGKTIKLDPASLSQRDQKYLEDNYGFVAPAAETTAKSNEAETRPRLDIEFTKISDSKMKKYSGGYDDYRDIDMICSVTIEKTNREPYTGELTGELYVVGHNRIDDKLLLLDTAKGSFNFKNDRTATFEGSHFTLREDAYNNKYGTEYESYLIIIKDANGRTMQIKSNSKDMEEHMNLLPTFEVGQYFDEDFKKLEYRNPTRTYYYYRYDKMYTR